MRVTSTTYTNLLINSSQSALQRQAQLQQQISTGNSVQLASDNPVAYGEATRTQADLVQLNNYESATAEATTMTTQNNNAMTSLHQIVAQAANLVTSVNGTMSTTDMQATATEMTSLLSQLTSVVNQTQNGNYLFGGTNNQQPLNPTTQNYNSSTNNVGETLTIANNTTVQVGILAGRPGSPAVSGFLYDASSGVDIVGALKNAITDLNAGNATAVQSTDVPALDASLNHLSQYVGSTAANMSAVATSSTLLQQQTLNQQTQLGNLTQASLANVVLQLQQVQTQYQASLESGTRIMNLSILNYMGGS